MRMFELDRREDTSGISGMGIVAEGVEFTDGTCVVRWLGETPTTVVHASMRSVERIHLSHSVTDLVWLACREWLYQSASCRSA